MQLSSLSCTVVICAYTEARWSLLTAGYLACLAQLCPGDEIVVVIDHNDDLYQRARNSFAVAVIVENSGPRGLSGARNTGVAVASGDVVIFLDDDASPEDGWLSAYRRAFAEERTAVVAGAVDALWEGGSAPRWFPDEFGWVVGCDYRGLPGDEAPIRNPIGANMGIRRKVIEAVGGFSTDVGRVGTKPVGCEETDLSIRVTQMDPSLRIVRTTDARVRHFVPAARRQVRYFLSRCYHEGRSKRILSARLGSADGLGAERTYVTRTLTSGFALGLAGPLHGRWSGPARSIAIGAGLSATAFGYLSARGVARATGPLPAEGGPAAAGWVPLRLIEFDLVTGRIVGDLKPGERARLLVLAEGNPLSFVDLAMGEPIPDTASLAALVGFDLATQRPPAAESVELDGSGPLVTVVVATRGRASELIR